jgi:hypothetical protein
MHIRTSKRSACFMGIAVNSVEVHNLLSVFSSNIVALKDFCESSFIQHVIIIQHLFMMWFRK